MNTVIEGREILRVLLVSKLDSGSRGELKQKTPFCVTLIRPSQPKEFTLFTI